MVTLHQYLSILPSCVYPRRVFVQTMEDPWASLNDNLRIHRFGRLCNHTGGNCGKYLVMMVDRWGIYDCGAKRCSGVGTSFIFL